MDLKELIVYSYSIESVTLMWEFEDVINPDDHTISIYRCEAPSDNLDEYDLIESGIDFDAPLYVDRGVEGLFDFNRTWFYKITTVETATGDETEYDERAAYINDRTTDFRHKHILRWKKRALKSFSGRDLYLLKRRTWGERCEANWDETLQRVTGDRCDECDCYGTGWKNGYFDPIHFKGMLNPNPKMNEISIFGEFRPSDSVLNTTMFPPLRPSDIVVDPATLRRYFIIQKRPVERLGVPIEQIAQISLIHSDDEVFEIEIKEPVYLTNSDNKFITTSDGTYITK